MALALVRHFGSIKALSRASLQQLLQFLPRRKAETLVAALSMSPIAESEHARSGVFDSPDAVYNACVDVKLLNQEALRVILLDTRDGRRFVDGPFLEPEMFHRAVQVLRARLGQKRRGF